MLAIVVTANLKRSMHMRKHNTNVQTCKVWNMYGCMSACLSNCVSVCLLVCLFVCLFYHVCIHAWIQVCVCVGHQCVCVWTTSKNVKLVLVPAGARCGTGLLLANSVQWSYALEGTLLLCSGPLLLSQAAASTHETGITVNDCAMAPRVLTCSI